MTPFTLNKRAVGTGHPVYIIAEMSANHNQDKKIAMDIIHAARDAGADAVKLQTYTPDTMTIESHRSHFRLKDTIWRGKTLYDLYGEAATPWEWLPDLKAEAEQIGLDLFSTPFDFTAVDFLEAHDATAYKIASFEIVDLPLLKKVGQTGKPVILSTGMASLAEIQEAVDTLRQSGCTSLALLKCTSAYPAPPEEANLKTIPHMAEAFRLPVGLSDHTMGNAVAVGAVSLGACIIEKHFTLSRTNKGPDSSFSIEPIEFKAMVSDIRILEKALGKVSYDLTEKQEQSLVFRRSLFVVKDMGKNDIFSVHNVRSIRPGNGMHTRYLPEILGKKSNMPIKKGTPLKWNMIE